MYYSIQDITSTRIKLFYCLNLSSDRYYRAHICKCNSTNNHNLQVAYWSPTLLLCSSSNPNSSAVKLPKLTGGLYMGWLKWWHQCPAPPRLTPWPLYYATRGKKYWYGEVSLPTRRGDLFFPTQCMIHSYWKSSIHLCIAVREKPHKHCKDMESASANICLSQAWVAKTCLSLHIFRVPIYLHTYKKISVLYC